MRLGVRRGTDGGDDLGPAAHALTLATGTTAAGAIGRLRPPWISSSSVTRSPSASRVGDGPGRPGTERRGLAPGRRPWPRGWPTRRSTPWSPARCAGPTRPPSPWPALLDLEVADGGRPGRVRPKCALVHPDRGAEGRRRPALARHARRVSGELGSTRRVPERASSRPSTGSSPPTRAGRWPPSATAGPSTPTSRRCSAWTASCSSSPTTPASAGSGRHGKGRRGLVSINETSHLRFANRDRP